MLTLRLRCFGALVLLAAAGAALSATGQNQIIAMVTVVSETGAPALLTPEDFVVREKNTPLQVDRIDRIHEVPLLVSILFDISKPALGVIPPVNDMRVAMAAFVEKVRSSNPAAQIALTEVAGAAVPTVKFDSAPEDLDRAVARLFIGQQPAAAMIEGLLETARGLKNVQAMRKVILLIDFGSHDPTNTATANQALREIQEALATVWSVSIAPASAGSSPRQAAVNAAVNSTGGHRLTAVSATGLKKQLETVADSLASQYLITVTRASSAPVNVNDIRAESKKGQKVLVTSLMR